MKMINLILAVLILMLASPSAFSLPTSSSLSIGEIPDNSQAMIANQAPVFLNSIGVQADLSGWKIGGSTGWYTKIYNPGDNTPVPDEGGYGDDLENLGVNTIPEPTSLILFGIGLAGLGIRKKFRA